jgi:hypothetical protein
MGEEEWLVYFHLRLQANLTTDYRIPQCGTDFFAAKRRRRRKANKGSNGRSADSLSAFYQFTG